MVDKLVVMVSSTVYGVEELLERIYTLLTAFGYEVWMSHKGTLPVFSSLSALENCREAVRRCDLFLGLITPQYGSGVEDGDISITHEELRLAIELNKPRWFLAHGHVVFARTLLRNLRREKSGRPLKFGLQVKKSDAIGDLRVIDMYEEAISQSIPLKERKGNWVQKYYLDNEALLFATAQFYRYQEVEAFIRENLKNSSLVAKSIANKRNG